MFKNMFFSPYLIIAGFSISSYFLLLRLSENSAWLTAIDPSFAYLVDSINLATFNHPGMCQHPGITLEIITSILLWIAYPFSQSGENGLAPSVLTQPYYYLQFIGHGIYILQTFIIFVTSAIIYHKTRKIFLPITLPLTIFIFPSVIILLGTMALRCENLFPSLEYFLFLAAFMRFQEINEQIESRYLGFFTGITCGLALFLKSTLAPIFLVSYFFWSKWRNGRLGWVVGLLSITLICLLIMGSAKIKESFLWSYNLFIHSGIYGHGNSNFIDKAYFLEHFKFIILHNKFYFVMLAGITAWLILKRRESRTFTWRITAGYLIASMILLVFISKHYNHHYLLPLYLPALFIYLSYFFQCSRKLKLTVFLVMIYISIINFNEIWRAPIKHSPDYPPMPSESILIHSYPDQSLPNALSFGNDWSKHSFTSELQKLYPDFLQYNIWNGGLYNFSSAPIKFTMNIDKKYYIIIFDAYKDKFYKNLKLGKLYKKLSHGFNIYELLDYHE